MFGSTDVNDDQLIDVDLWLGDPFPLVVGTKEVESDESFSKPLVGVTIGEHVGVRDNVPVAIQPAQLVSSNGVSCCIVNRLSYSAPSKLSSMILARN